MHPLTAPLLDFDGRVAIVTGAARGLGRAAVERLHERGACVVINARDHARAQALVDALGERAIAVAGDITHAELARLHRSIGRKTPVTANRVLKLVKRLEDWPSVSGVKRLTGHLAGTYRLRTGDYRLRFRVNGDTVVVEKIGHRKDIYED